MSKQESIIILPKNIIAWIIGGLLICFIAYCGTNALFKNIMKQNCIENQQMEETVCGCISKVVSSKISFIGKWQLIVLGGSPIEVMENVPVIELMACSMGDIK